MPAAGFVPQVMAQSVPLAMDDDAAARMGLPQPEAAQASEDRSPHGTLKLYAPLKHALNLLLVGRTRPPIPAPPPPHPRLHWGPLNPHVHPSQAGPAAARC